MCMYVHTVCNICQLSDSMGIASINHVHVYMVCLFDGAEPGLPHTTDVHVRGRTVKFTSQLVWIVIVLLVHLSCGQGTCTLLFNVTN